MKYPPCSMPAREHAAAWWREHARHLSDARRNEAVGLTVIAKRQRVLADQAALAAEVWARIARRGESGDAAVGDVEDGRSR